MTEFLTLLEVINLFYKLHLCTKVRQDSYMGGSFDLTQETSSKTVLFNLILNLNQYFLIFRFLFW